MWPRVRPAMNKQQEAQRKQRKDNAARRAPLVEAAELEARADTITRSIAVMDMQRQRLYARAAAFRGGTA